MSRAARFGVRRPKLVIAGWAMFVVVLGFWGGGMLGNEGVEDKLLPTRLLVNGTDSNRADELAKGHFGEKLAVLLTGPADEIDRQGRRTCACARDTSEHERDIAVGTARPRREASAEPGAGRDHARCPSEERRDGQHLHPAARSASSSSGSRPPVKAHLSGLDVIGRAQNDQVVQSIQDAEQLAFPILIIVLLLVLRTPVAAAIPLIMGLGTARAGFGVLNIVADHMRLDAIALSMASMIGLTLGVDYSLLIVSRFREALDDGKPVPQAASLAANTAGRTAAFAGFVLLAMMLVVIVLSVGTVMRSAAIGAIVVTILSMASAVLVTPGCSGSSGSV